MEVARVHDERLERLARRPLTRRAILKGAGATAAAMTLSRSKIAFAAGQPRIAIIGAGISGLSAALTLADVGVASTVYESSGRIGGRMFSNTSYWDHGQVSEWGGELIDTGHATIRALAKRFDLHLDDLHKAEPSGSEETYFVSGHYYPKAQATLDFKPVHAALKQDTKAAGYPTTFDTSTPAGQALDAMSVYDWIESRVPGGHASPMGLLLDAAYNIEYGADTRDQSALNIVYLLGFQKPGVFEVFGESDERFHIRGGNQQLPVAIANYLGVGSVVQTGMRMLSIARTSAGAYTLAFSTGNGTEVVTADMVILTLPFAVLRNLNYAQAGFDANKERAIQKLGRGRNGKLQLQFRNRIWNATGPWPGVATGSSFADTGYQSTWDVTRAQAGNKGILVDYTGGSTSTAMATQVAWGTAATPHVTSDAQRFLSQAEPVFPGLSNQWNGKATSSLPHLDPNLQLSYSFWKVGQYTSIAGYEGKRQNNVFFAGEHTSTDFQGFMEGGASEGVRAANEVLTSLGKK